MSLSGGDAIFGVKLGDDVTATARAMAGSVKDLRENLQVLNRNFRESRSDMRPLSIGLREARQLFNASGQNIKLFQASLKDAGISAQQSGLLINKVGKEHENYTRRALGLNGVIAKAFNPVISWAERHQTAISGLRAAMMGIKNVAGGLGGLLSKGLGLAGSVGSRAIGAGGDLVDSVLDAYKFKENSILSLKSSLFSSGESPDEASSQKRAGELFKAAQKLAIETPLDTDEVVETYTKLMTARFNSGESEVLTKLVADQQTKFGKQAGTNAVNALARVKGRGFASVRDLGSFRIAGFSEKDISLQLAERYGIKGKDDDKVEKIRKMLSKRKISDYTFINAAIATQEKRGGGVGEFAKKNSETLTGTLSNFKSAFGDLISSVDLDKWPGVKAFKEFLGRITNALKPAQDGTNKILDSVQEVANSILGGLDRITETDIAAWVGHVKDFALVAGKAIREVWHWFDELIHSSGGLSEGMKNVLFDVGSVIAQGASEGLKLVAKSAFGFGDDGISGSPSDEFTNRLNMGSIIGGGIDEDWSDAIPKLADGGLVTKPTLAIVGEAGPEAVIPLNRYSRDPSSLSSIGGPGGGRSSGGGGISVTVGDINISGVSGLDASDPDALANAIRPMLVDVFTSEFERLAAEGG